MQEAIQVKDLSKKFFVRKNFPGVRGAIKGLFHKETSEVTAIDRISFSISRGERVAFIGPNGAGKSTTIKMLTGILHPSSGEIKVLGLTPWEKRSRLGYEIGAVFGQRSQLWYQLPPSDTFLLLSKIYDLDRATFERDLKELVEIFEIGRLLEKPVRQLSLGERMRCELVASLLHKPKILFLDEPTIGLDISAKLKIRALLNKLSKEEETTLFLTSHDTGDIEQVCDRVLILDKGKIMLDTSLKDLKKSYVKKKVLRLTTTEESLPLHLPGVEVLENKNYNFVCEVNLSLMPIEQVVHETLKVTTLKDVTIEDPSMEEIIRNLYLEAPL
ncbi:MAG: ATP-binding cassette domain-containing protein [Verrucomicrobia bacterium]|nr:ATP-binding cassette domain-containing protein [Verrucomicrobiota bacterium]